MKSERTLILFNIMDGDCAFEDALLGMIANTIVANCLSSDYFHASLDGDAIVNLGLNPERLWCVSTNKKEQCFRAIIVEGHDVVGIIERLLGPADLKVARSMAPGSIRGQFLSRALVHSSKTAEAAEIEIEKISPFLSKTAKTPKDAIKRIPSFRKLRS